MLFGLLPVLRGCVALCSACLAGGCCLLLCGVGVMLF